MKESHSMLCALKGVYREIYRFEQDLRDATGLSVNEAMILCTLTEAQSTSGDLAEELSLSAGRMSRILDSLEKKGYIVRAFGENDRRVITVTITQSGGKTLSRLRTASLREPDFIKNINNGGNR